MKELSDKLQGHTQYLLGCFLGILEKYAFLRPMLFEKEVINIYGGNRKARGFNAIKYSLFHDCVQDIAKITMDKDPRTPSIKNILKGLEDPKTLEILREEFSIWHIPKPENENETFIKILQKMEKEEEVQRREQFNQIYSNLLEKWGKFQKSSPIDAFQKIRDKLTAHLELKKINGEYKRTDISALGLRWGDVENALNSLQEIILDLNCLIRNADFDIESLSYTLEKASKSYWETNAC